MSRLSKVLLVGFAFTFLSRGSFAFDEQAVLYEGQREATVELVDHSVVDRAPTYARVRLSFGAAPAGSSPNELFVVRLEGERIEVLLRTSGRILIARNAPRIRVVRSTARVSIEADYSYEFIDAGPISRIVEEGISRFRLVRGVLSFETDERLFEQGFVVRLSVTRFRPVEGGEIVLDRSLDAKDLKATPIGFGRALYEVPLSSLGLSLGGPIPYVFDVFARFDFESSRILNAEDLPNGGRMSSRMIPNSSRGETLDSASRLSTP